LPGGGGGSPEGRKRQQGMLEYMDAPVYDMNTSYSRLVYSQNRLKVNPGLPGGGGGGSPGRIEE